MMTTETNDTYETVLRQQETIRRSGQINMSDRSGVQRIAYDREFYQLVNWIEDHSAEEYIEMAKEAAERFRGQPDNEVVVG